MYTMNFCIYKLIVYENNQSNKQLFVDNCEVHIVNVCMNTYMDILVDIYIYM